MIANKVDMKMIGYIIGSIIRIPFIISPSYQLFQYKDETKRAQQISLQMFISFIITETLMSLRNLSQFICRDETHPTNTYNLEKLSLVINSILSVFLQVQATMMLLWIKLGLTDIKYRNRLLYPICLGLLLLVAECGLHLLIYFLLRENQYNKYEKLFGILVNSFIIINAICPFPFGGFNQSDYKKIPFFTVVSGACENICWFVIYHLCFDKGFTKISGIVGNFGAASCHLVNLGLYIKWKKEHNDRTTYTKVSEI